MDGAMIDVRTKLISRLAKELTEKTGHEWRKSEHLDDIVTTVEIDGITHNFAHSVRLMHLDADQSVYANFVEKSFQKWLSGLRSLDTRQTHTTDPRQAKPL